MTRPLGGSRPDAALFPRLRFGYFRAGKGWCAAAWTRRGLSALILPRKDRVPALRDLHGYLPPLTGDGMDAEPSRVPQSLVLQVRKALRGEPFRWDAFDLFFLTSFQRGILDATRLIPWGQVRTYGWVAKKAGSPRGFRAAGQALNRNPIPLLIPCHRVIASGGRLGGYGGGLEWKIRLLNKEGLAVDRGLVGVS